MSKLIRIGILLSDQLVRTVGWSAGWLVGWSAGRPTSLFAVFDSLQVIVPWSPCLSSEALV